MQQETNVAEEKATVRKTRRNSTAKSFWTKVFPWIFLAIALILFAAYVGRMSNTPATEAPVQQVNVLQPTAPQSVPNTPVPQPTQPVVQPTQPVVQPTAVPPAPVASGTFNYVPGGPNYAWPEIGAVEEMGDGWTRIRQDANGQFNAWTFFVRIACDQEIGNRLQWDSSTKLEVYGPISCKIELKRDLASSKSISPDPYTVANAKNSPLGLGWFVTGTGKVTANGVSFDLSGPGVKQFAFPKDWDGTWVITVVVPQNGVMTFNQGERLTPNDNFPLP